MIYDLYQPSARERCKSYILTDYVPGKTWYSLLQKSEVGLRDSLDILPVTRIESLCPFPNQILIAIFLIFQI